MISMQVFNFFDRLDSQLSYILFTCLQQTREVRSYLRQINIFYKSDLKTAQDTPAEATLVEKVMTPNPECATIDAPIADALHIMHDGKFLHLPFVYRDGFVVSIVDVLHVTHAAIATVGNATGVNNEGGSSVMQTFLDSAMALTPAEDEDDETRRL